MHEYHLDLKGNIFVVNNSLQTAFPSPVGCTEIFQKIKDLQL
jgi:hypothetical protein